jgi:hypothetical protein
MAHGDPTAAGVEAARSPADILTELEERWRQDLVGVNLVAELDLMQRQIDTALKCLGLIWQSAGSTAVARRRIRSSFPACMVVATSGSASILLKGLRILPELLASAGLDPEDNLGQAWGELFRECLESLGMQDFPELDRERARRFVSRMLLHGGIPLDQLGTWLDLVADTAARLPGASGADIQAWMVERAEVGRLYEATTTLQRFVRFGAEFAADFIDRSLELLDRLHEGDQGIIDVGLPQRYVARARELEREGALPLKATAKLDRRSPQDVRPKVMFDPYGLGVVLVLPSIESDDGVRWTVDLGASPETIRLAPQHPTGRTPSLDLPIPMGVAEATVERDSSPVVSVALVPRDEPLLIFDESGRLIPRSATLPRMPVWCLAPDDRALECPGAQELTIRQSVPRWPGWFAQQLDLANAGRVQLVGALSRRIQTNRSAALVDLEPFVGLGVDEGGVVLRRWPTLLLPVAPAPFDWQVTIESLDGVGNSALLDVHVATEDIRIPLRDHGAHLAGRPVQLRARGPLGSDLRRVITVVDDLELHVQPALRSAQDGVGLDPCSVELWKGSTVLASVVLGPKEDAALLTLPSNTVVSVQPPTVSFEHVVEGRSSVRRMTPVTVLLEGRDGTLGALMVRVPEAQRFALVLVAQDGQRVQSLRPSGAESPGVALFDLERARDTLAEYGTVVAVLETDRWTGRAALITHAELALEAVGDDARRMVQFFGVTSAGLLAGWYPRFAPGTPPVVIQLAAGDPNVVVPDEVAGLGPVRIMLQPDDPWVAPHWPPFPSATLGNCFDVNLSVGPEATVRAPLARQLTGELPFPEVIRDPMPALHVFLHAEELGAAVTPHRIRTSLRDLLADRDALVLRHLGEVEARPSDVAELACELGLVARVLPPDIPDDTLEVLWARWSGLGGLLTAAQLVDPRSRRTALLLLEARCGPNVRRLLEGEDIAELSQPRFDEPALLAMPRPVLEQLRRASGIVPRGLLDTDARADDGFELVVALTEMGERSLLNDVSRREMLLLSQAKSIAGPNIPPVLGTAIRRRLQGSGVQALPAVSLAIAVAARCSARTGSSLPSLLGEALAALAAVRPSLIAADLLMAELALLSTEINISAASDDDGALGWMQLSDGADR